MPHVAFTRHLKSFFPTLTEQDVPGQTIAEVVRELDARYPGLAAYVVDDQGSLRQHVNIFIGEEMIRDRVALGDAVGEGDRVFIFQALSGG